MEIFSDKGPHDRFGSMLGWYPSLWNIRGWIALFLISPYNRLIATGMATRVFRGQCINKLHMYHHDN